MTYMSLLMVIGSLAVVAAVGDVWAAWHPTYRLERRIVAGRRVIALGRDAVGQALRPMAVVGAWALSHGEIAASLTSPIALNAYCAALPVVGGAWGVAQLRREQTVCRLAAAIAEFLGRGEVA